MPIDDNWMLIANYSNLMDTHWWQLNTYYQLLKFEPNSVNMDTHWWQLNVYYQLLKSETKQYPHAVIECKLVQDQVANQDQHIAKFQLKDLVLL